MKMPMEERKRLAAEVLSAMKPAGGKASYSEEEMQYYKRSKMEELEIDTYAGKTRLFLIRPYNLPEKDFPVFINLHSGGFVKGHGDRDLFFSGKIAERTEGIVVDVDYHTVESCMFPTPFEETYDVAKWVFAHAKEWGADLNRISIGGHSAGATLSAAAVLKANQTREFRIAGLVLDYGCFDMFTDPYARPYAIRNRLKPDILQKVNTLYTEDEPELIRDPYVSIITAPDSMLYGFPDTLIISAGKDVFRFEDEELGRRLVACGVNVTMRRYLRSDHGFIISGTDEWKPAHEQIIHFLRDAQADTNQK